jgi:hypothetical protein
LPVAVAGSGLPENLPCTLVDAVLADNEGSSVSALGLAA